QGDDAEIVLHAANLLRKSVENPAWRISKRHTHCATVTSKKGSTRIIITLANSFHFDQIK
ncbi:MAG: hypothetical protein NWR86_01420, partial [Schleiferiaceae bacterium]|nr:hypothetical protein [Schleiferiaceae bacterium]